MWGEEEEEQSRRAPSALQAHVRADVERGVVEMDGPHHFTPCAYRGNRPADEAERSLWERFAKQVERDHVKEAHFQSKRVPMLRIALTDYADAELHVKMDSKLVVEQMSGRWKIKHPDMRELAREAWEILRDHPVTFEWVPRADNARADALANASMDARADIDR